MVASAFLPAVIHKGRLYLLFGREAHDDGAPGFSDFGGGVEPGEDVFEAGLREFAEETTGFFGGPEDVRELVRKSGGALLHTHKTYHIHVFRAQYDAALARLFTRSARFIHARVKNKAFLRKTCIFEKVEMVWMTVEEARARREEFRPFYREILDELLGARLAEIERFARQGGARRSRRRAA